MNRLASAARTPNVRAARTTASSRQVPALDGIRGLAIIWVVFHNATDEEFAAGGVFHLLTLLTHPGWIGVQLFFALSGFLITSGLLKMQGAPHYFRNFYAKRALRILPLYYTVLLVLLVVLPRVGRTRLRTALPTSGRSRSRSSSICSGRWCFAGCRHGAC